MYVLFSAELELESLCFVGRVENYDDLAGHLLTWEVGLAVVVIQYNLELLQAHSH